MADFVRLFRSLGESDIWLGEVFTRGQAWVDLLMKARWKPGHARIRGVRIDLDRGQLAWSEVALAKRWQWSRNRVRRFLKELQEKEEMIELHKDNSTTIITIKNYDKYQGGDTAEYAGEKRVKSTFSGVGDTANDTADDTANDTANDTADDTRKKKDKKGKNDKNGQEGQECPSSPDGDSSSPEAGEDVSVSEEDSLPTAPAKKKDRHPPCPHNKIIDLYHELLPELPKVQVWGEKARGCLQKRWRDDPARQNIEWWRWFFTNYIRSSDFLMGKVNSFQVTLDWMVRPQNFEKILNGNYINRGPRTGSERTDRNIQVAREWLEEEGVL